MTPDRLVALRAASARLFRGMLRGGLSVISIIVLVAGSSPFRPEGELRGARASLSRTRSTLHAPRSRAA